MRHESNGGGLPAAQFVVGDWTVVPSRNVIARDGNETRLEPRLMDALVVLAERPDQPVSKDELVDRVWKRQYVTDDVVTVTISALRKALGDDARNPRYIETVSRRGYRLIAGVRSATQPAPAASSPEKPQAPRRRLASSPMVVSAAVAIVIAAVTWSLFGARATRHVPNAESHEAYVKGRYFLDQRSIQGWQQALDNFRRAVALDAKNPAAHAGLADTYSSMADFGVRPSSELRPLAMTSAQRALALDPHSAEGLEALGRAQFLFDWDFAAAERSLGRAAELDPDYMPTHQAIAWLTSARGEHARAIAAARRALQLDPVNTARYWELARVYALAGQTREALREGERALQLNPRSWQTHVMQGWVYEVAGNPDSAFISYQNAWRISGASEEFLRGNEASYRREGLAGYYRSWLQRSGTSGPSSMSETSRAQLYARLGDRDAAIAALQRAYQKREGALAWVNVEPTLQTLRDDVRFQQLAARVRRAN